MVTYQLVVETSWKPEVGNYSTFGVSAWRVDGDAIEKIDYVPDVFLSKEKAERFISVCERLELDICHFRDVIEDWLVE